jgi:hypothetical protein
MLFKSRFHGVTEERKVYQMYSAGIGTPREMCPTHIYDLMSHDMNNAYLVITC